MKASEQRYYPLLAVLASILTSVCVLAFCYYQVWYYFSYVYNGDLGGYLDVIESGENAGWWAPITLGLLHQLYTSLKSVHFFSFFSIDCSITDVFWFYRMACRFMGLLFALSVGFLVFSSVRRSLWNLASALSLCIFALFLSFHIHLGSRLDFFFVAELFAALALLQAMGVGGRWWKRSVSAAYFVLLLLMVDARHNAILILPLFLAAWGWKFFPGMRLRRMLLFVLLAGIATVACRKGAEACLVNRTAVNPSHVMLLSDLRMAAILRGDYQAYAYHNPRQRPMADWVRPGAADGEDPVDSNPMGKFFNAQHRTLVASCVSELQHVYDEPVSISDIIDEYLKELRTHPRELLMARLMTIEQFFLGTEHMQWERSLISSVCPAVRDDEDAWMVLPQREKFSGERLDVVRGSALVWYAVSLVVAMAFASRYRKRMLLLDNTVRSAILAVSSAFVYLLSFLAVTPTSDFRYHYPSLALLCYGTPILLLALWRNCAAHRP